MVKGRRHGENNGVTRQLMHIAEKIKKGTVFPPLIRTGNLKIRLGKTGWRGNCDEMRDNLVISNSPYGRSVTFFFGRKTTWQICMAISSIDFPDEETLGMPLRR